MSVHVLNEWTGLEPAIGVRSSDTGRDTDQKSRFSYTSTIDRVDSRILEAAGTFGGQDFAQRFDCCGNSLCKRGPLDRRKVSRCAIEQLYRIGTDTMAQAKNGTRILSLTSTWLMSFFQWPEHVRSCSECIEESPNRGQEVSESMSRVV